MNVSVNHFGGYDVRPRLGHWVVYDCTGKRAVPCRFPSGHVVAYVCAVDAYLWIAEQILRHVQAVRS